MLVIVIFIVFSFYEGVDPMDEKEFLFFEVDKVLFFFSDDGP